MMYTKNGKHRQYQGGVFFSSWENCCIGGEERGNGGRGGGGVENGR